MKPQTTLHEAFSKGRSLIKDKEATKVVVIGGGTGQPLVLKALVALGYSPKAIVTMADDGGSSGRLRKEMGVVPPGDVRNCLAALAGTNQKEWGDLLGYRFNAGIGLEGHALGNLILVALADITNSFEESVKKMEEVLEVQGRVLPSTFDDVMLHGFDRAGNQIDGQESLASNRVAIAKACLEPDDARANKEALEAIFEADFIIVGPGSLYTSLIPNFLIPEITAAVQDSKAKLFYICNVANMRGETTDFDAVDHVEALLDHGLDNRIDLALIQTHHNEAEDKDIEVRVRELGVKTRFAELVDEKNPMRHDTEKLKIALGELL